MAGNNIFEGKSCRASLARTAYKLLMTRQWISYVNVLESYLGKEIDYNVSKFEQYGELKKAFPAVVRLIQEKAVGSIDVRGNNRNKEYCYVGEDDNPLNDIINTVVIKDLKTYWQFCQDSAGFFPIAWLNHFFHNTQDLFDIKERKNKGGDIISTSLDHKLENIELLPILYEAIKQQQVLSLDYETSFNAIESLVFHPHYLREYNGRWFLFGKIEGKDYLPTNLALDRIRGYVDVTKTIAYVPAPRGFYAGYFKDMVGVSHKHHAAAIDVRLRAYTSYCFNLINTKPLHQSQQVVSEFKGNYGEFQLYVEPNNELIGRILQMGHLLEVVAPKSLRQTVAERIAEMAKRYSEMVPSEKEPIE